MSYTESFILSKICIKLNVFFLYLCLINSPAKQPPTMSTTTSSSSWMSLYIPVVPSDLSIGGVVMDNEMAFQHYFEYMLPMGKVSRVDFVSKPARDGDKKVTSAFVHFSGWFDQGSTYQDVSSMLERDDEVRLVGGASSFDGSPVDFVSASNPSRKRFIVIKINRAPVKRAAEIPKNIHQILNNYGLMEGLISDQNARIEELSTLVARLRQTIMEMEAYEGDARVPSVVEEDDLAVVEDEAEDVPMDVAELA